MLYISVLLWALTACTADDLPRQGTVGEEEVWSTLRFGHRSFDEVDVQTRATLSEIAESRVENLFAYVFDADGNRLYSHFYDYLNRVVTLPTEPENCWTVSNRTTANNNDTEGEIMIKSPTMTGGSIYLIANLNADQLNISAAQLNTVRSLSELQALTITLNQEITSRTGSFLMTGSATGITIGDDGEVTTDAGGSVRIPLVRLDAKVTVNVCVGEATIEGQEMKEFVPESWQVMRLPKGTRLLPATDDADALGSFDGEEQFFEADTDGMKSFSFYMLENMEDTEGLTTFNQRDLRSKNTDGTYNTAGGLWEHASEEATYLVIKGKVQMEVSTDEEYALQYLEADVTYYVHLGNFGDSKSGGNYNDFTIRRNTHYTYTLTIKGVNNIEVEVTDNVENQSGATGDVYKSREEIYTFDAHYGQRVYRIDAESILPGTITWYVKTPFSEGTPGIESGTQIPNLDYKWVWFMVNKTEYNGVYSTKNRWYPGDDNKNLNIGDEGKLMDVVEFTRFVKEEKAKLDAAADDEKGTASAFKSDNNGDYCMYVTVFVDEYYYEADPLNSENKPQDLWKKFVNQPNRLIHILCDSELSKDGESSLTNSVITIRQRSIQTPYNIEDGELLTAWGCESVDEFADSHLFFYDTGERITDTSGHTLGTSIPESSDVNGLYNSLHLWDITLGSTRWDTYLDYERDNDHTATIGGNALTTYFLKDDYAVLRYATLQRNRDNNGNGVIDEDELRWYVASVNQLYDLYIGQLGLNSDAALYTPQMAAQSGQFTSGPYSGAYKWRNHIISSTWSGGNGSDAQVKILWAEEGITVDGYYSGAVYSKWAPFSARTVRNLGLTSPAVTEVGEEGVGYPVMLVQVTEPTDEHGYLFNLSRLNEKSIRYYTSRELVTDNENSEAARLYYGFETGATVSITEQGGNYNSGNYLHLREALESGTDIGCDTENGFRVPNVREAALMSLYCSQSWWNGGYTMTGSWFSNGNSSIGGNNNDPNYYSWQFGYKFTSIGKSDVTTIRTVRDRMPE